MLQLKIVINNHLQPEVLHYDSLARGLIVINAIKASRRQRTNEFLEFTDDYENSIGVASEHIACVTMSEISAQLRIKGKIAVAQHDAERQATIEINSKPRLQVP